MNTRRLEDGPLIAVAALVFIASAAVTVVWCGSMAAMPGMEMPGGWVMSMAWMRMPGQGWAGAAASFIGMWSIMMVAMMLPVIWPMLMRYRRGQVEREGRDSRTLVMACGYFAVWIGVGALLYPAGVALMDYAMRSAALSLAMPFAAAAAMLIAGALQLSRWKLRQLECCAKGQRVVVEPSLRAAWRHGLQLGLRCNFCCVSLTATLLVIGVMDLWAMAVVMTAISAERLLPAGVAVARVLGALILVLGLLMLFRAMGG